MNRRRVAALFLCVWLVPLIFQNNIQNNIDISTLRIVSGSNSKNGPPFNSFAPSATLDINSGWDVIFDAVDVSYIKSIVRTLSENYPQRVWYPLDKKPSQALADAWEYVKNEIDSATNGKVQLENWTEHQTLVGILKGSTTNLAPIIIAGTIASRYEAGVNEYGASVAAVIESARILSQYSLTNDVIFILTNTITGGYGTGSLGNVGTRAVLDKLYEEGRIPAAIFWYSRLLYRDPNETGSKHIAIVSEYHTNQYLTTDFTASIAMRASEFSGRKWLTTSNVQLGWSQTGAYDGAARGVPSFVLSQLQNYPGADKWDNPFFYYEQAAEAVGVVTSLVWLLGNVNRGSSPAFSGGISLPRGYTKNRTMPLSSAATVSVTINWIGATKVRGYIMTPELTVLTSSTSDDNSLALAYTVSKPGVYYLVVENLGNTTAVIDYSFTQFMDFDNDGLDDYTEYDFRSDGISPDTDADGLDDYSEYVLHTNPRDSDTDNDGAEDGIEVELGANPLIIDTDGDSLLDGFEIDFGLDPTSADSDSDGVDDGTELELGLDPLNEDSDEDGLIDSLELEHGCDPLSVDTDNDSLSDLFEVLNNLDPLSNDSDGDGLSDLFEVENGMLPFSNDSDSDFIPDGIDWAPTSHWINDVPLVGTVIFVVYISFWLLKKRREYLAGADGGV